MTTIAILPESSGGDATIWRAVAGDRESTGKTAGEALDAISAQLDENEISTLVIVQRLQPDRFFSDEQRKRLEQLMARWRDPRNTNGQLPTNEQSELEALVEAELEAATRRAEAVVDELRK